MGSVFVCLVTKDQAFGDVLSEQARAARGILVPCTLLGLPTLLDGSW